MSQAGPLSVTQGWSTLCGSYLTPCLAVHLHHCHAFTFQLLKAPSQAWFIAWKMCFRTLAWLFCNYFLKKILSITLRHWRIIGLPEIINISQTYGVVLKFAAKTLSLSPRLRDNCWERMSDHWAPGLESFSNICVFCCVWQSGSSWLLTSLLCRPCLDSKYVYWGASVRATCKHWAGLCWQISSKTSPDT